jgi:hypothetical protein
MNLKELARSQTAKKPNHSILIYGKPKTGKTKLVGTAAKLPEIKRIFWFDGENGAETLLHMGLTDKELEKITLYSIPDTRDNPRFIETLLKSFSSKNPVAVKICDEHGKVGCVECDTKNALPNTIAGKPVASYSEFYMPGLTKSDLVVIDSGSQLGDSALAMACAGKPVEFKPGWDEYGLQVKWLGDIMGVIQACHYTNFVMITHIIPIEEEINGIKKDIIFPLCGTKAFCQKVAKYFGTVVFTEIKLGKHAAGSGSTYKTEVLTGSRTNAKIENAKELSIKAILVEGGILSSEL